MTAAVHPLAFPFFLFSKRTASASLLLLLLPWARKACQAGIFCTGGNSVKTSSASCGEMELRQRVWGDGTTTEGWR